MSADASLPDFTLHPDAVLGLLTSVQDPRTRASLARGYQTAAESWADTARDIRDRAMAQLLEDGVSVADVAALVDMSVSSVKMVDKLRKARAGQR